MAAQLLTDPNVDNDPGTTDGVSYAKQTVRNLLGTVDLVEKAMWVVTVLFAFAVVLLTSTTVRLSIFARRREVEIMQLVGATNWFIRWPFVLEGFITGLIGSLIAALAVWGANVIVYNWIHHPSSTSCGRSGTRSSYSPAPGRSASSRRSCCWSAPCSAPWAARWRCAATCASEPSAGPASTPRKAASA